MICKARRNPSSRGRRNIISTLFGYNSPHADGRLNDCSKGEARDTMTSVRSCRLRRGTPATGHQQKGNDLTGPSHKARRRTDHARPNRWAPPLSAWSLPRPAKDLMRTPAWPLDNRMRDAAARQVARSLRAKPTVRGITRGFPSGARSAYLGATERELSVGLRVLRSKVSPQAGRRRLVSAVRAFRPPAPQLSDAEE